MSELAKRLAATARVERAPVAWQSRYNDTRRTTQPARAIVLVWRVLVVLCVCGAVWLLASALSAEFARQVATTIR